MKDLGMIRHDEVGEDVDKENSDKEKEENFGWDIRQRRWVER